MVEQLTRSDRVFAAILPPAEVVMALADWLADRVIPGKAVAPRDWHITLRYAGALAQVTYERWCASLDAIRFEPPPVRLAGMGAFPRARNATVLWSGVDSAGISGLAQAVEDAAEAAGIEAEDRPFRPHLTLSRIRPPSDITALAGDGPGPLRWRADRFHTLSRRQGHYRILDTFEL